MNSFNEESPAMKESRIRQPSFDGRINVKRTLPKKNHSNLLSMKLDSMVLISGTAHKELSQEISSLVGVPLLNITLSRFADGEVSVQFNENIRGKNVFVIQSCAGICALRYNLSSLITDRFLPYLTHTAPVNDSIVELLLTISCARRSGARRVTAVIPYFGFKYHRRQSSISSKHHSRYLTSGAKDFAKMLEEMGVDRVIAVDLQRPGQGHEACFFDNTVPLETIVTTDYMINHFINHVHLQTPIVVVSPNAEGMKKARYFQLGFQRAFETDVELAVYEGKESGSGPRDTAHLEMIGDATVKGADVVIVDDMIDTAGTIFDLSKKLHAAGARNIYVSATHGLFTENAMQLIEEAPIEKIVVTNTLPLHQHHKKSDHSISKVEIVSIAEMLSHVILAEHFRSVPGALLEEEFEMDS
jgi:ribose-phosphate pyrophosphokinase